MKLASSDDLVEGVSHHRNEHAEEKHHEHNHESGIEELSSFKVQHISEINLTHTPLKKQLKAVSIGSAS